MRTIFWKEVNLFFSSLIGYVSISVFLIITGLVLWVFPDTGVLDYGYATLETLFYIAPWVFMLLLPAITMRSFSEEFRSGTIETLTTRPLSDMAIIMGKYLAAVFLVIMSLLPTLVYYFTIYKLGSPEGNLDRGAIWGSYIGLFLLAAIFAAIGIFASSLTANQIVAFLLAVFLCFFVYAAFDYLSRLNIFYAKLDNFVAQMGIQAHYNAISRGVVDTRDIVYFGALIAFFLLLTRTILESRKW